MLDNRPPLRVRVLTYDLRLPADAEPVRERVIDYGDRGARKWLTGHCAWAFTNHHAVETFNVNDDV